MIKTLPLLCVAWLLGNRALLAVPPVVFPAGDFSCTVEVTPHTQSPGSDPAHPEPRVVPRVKKIVITQVGVIRRDVSVYTDNNTSQLWYLVGKDISVLESSGPKKDLYVLRGARRDDACPELLHFDAGSVAWITAKTLDESSEGSAALHYRAEIPLPVVDGLPKSILYQAWIDPKTRVPLKFDDGGSLYTVIFSSTVPAGPLVVPDNVQAELSRWQEATTAHAHL